MVLIDLINASGTHFSPNSWRVRMALAHKGLAFDVRDIGFMDVPNLHPQGEKVTIPTLVHGEKWVTDSWAIVRYLDDAFPNTPRLSGTGSETALLQFFQSWVQTTVHAGLARLIMQDLHRSLLPTDQAYFRESRERIYKMTIEEIQAGREERVAAFHKSLQPMRQSLQAQPFLGGAQPSYADYLAFGGFQWARISSPFAVLNTDDVVHTWFERCLDLYDGLGRQDAASQT